MINPNSVEIVDNGLDFFFKRRQWEDVANYEGNSGSRIFGN